MRVHKVAKVVAGLLLPMAARAQSPTVMLDTASAPQITNLCGRNAAASAVFVDMIARNESGDQAVLVRYPDPASGSSQVHFSIFTKDVCVVSDGLVGNPGKYILSIVPNSVVYRGNVVAYEAVFADSQNAAMTGNVKRGVFTGCELKYQIDDHPQPAPPAQAKQTYSTPDYGLTSDGRVIMKAPVSKTPSFQIPPVPGSQGSAQSPNSGWRRFQ